MTIKRKDKEKSHFLEGPFSLGVFIIVVIHCGGLSSRALLPALALAFSTRVLCALLEVFHASLLKGNLGQGFFSFSFFFALPQDFVSALHDEEHPLCPSVLKTKQNAKMP